MSAEQIHPAADRTKLAASLHSAQAQGLLRDSRAVASLLLGVASPIAQSAEGNARDQAPRWALQNAAYWDYFEMDIKEVLLGAFSGLEPSLCDAVRQVVELTLGSLRKAHLCA